MKKNKLYLLSLSTFFFFTACASTKTETMVPIPIEEPVRTVSIRFEKPLTSKMPEKEPRNVEEHIRTGLFYFHQEKYLSARDQFEQARQRISNHENPLYRNCLISIAVCDLLTDDKQAFVKTVRELKSTYTKYELVDIRGRDGRVKTILSLYSKLIINGNY